VCWTNSYPSTVHSVIYKYSNVFRRIVLLNNRNVELYIYPSPTRFLVYLYLVFADLYLNFLSSRWWFLVRYCNFTVIFNYYLHQLFYRQLVSTVGVSLNFDVVVTGIACCECNSIYCSTSMCATPNILPVLVVYIQVRRGFKFYNVFFTSFNLNFVELILSSFDRITDRFTNFYLLYSLIPINPKRNRFSAIYIDISRF